MDVRITNAQSAVEAAKAAAEGIKAAREGKGEVRSLQSYHVSIGA